MQIIELATERLRLRQWQVEDLPVFAQLNQDAEVMEYFPSLLNRAQSDEMAKKCQSLIAKKGWGLWVVELKETKAFMGFVGLYEPDVALPCSPCVEIGWRLLKQYWGCGYATEAAKRVLECAFKELALTEVVSFTAVNNYRSRAVMERLGLSNSQQNFMHPALPKNHPLAEHVLYKIESTQWQKSNL